MSYNICYLSQCVGLRSSNDQTTNDSCITLAHIEIRFNMQSGYSNRLPGAD